MGKGLNDLHQKIALHKKKKQNYKNKKNRIITKMKSTQRLQFKNKNQC